MQTKQQHLLSNMTKTYSNSKKTKAHIQLSLCMWEASSWVALCMWLLPTSPFLWQVALVSLLLSHCDELEPLPECITERLWQGVDISQDHVEGEGKLVHVGADLRQLSWPSEDGHLDVQDGILQHPGGLVTLWNLRFGKYKTITFCFSYPGVRVVQHHKDDKDISTAGFTHRCHHPLLSLQEESPAIRHDHQQLGRLYGATSQVRQKQGTTSGSLIIWQKALHE